MIKAGLMAKIARIPLRTVQYWTKSGLITPSVREGSGRGNHRVYSLVDVIQAKVIRKLRKQGVSLQKLRKISDYLRGVEELENPFTGAHFITDGENVFKVVEEDKVIEVLTGQMTLPGFVVNLHETVQETKEKAQKLGVAV